MTDVNPQDEREAWRQLAEQLADAALNSHRATYGRSRLGASTALAKLLYETYGVGNKDDNGRNKPLTAQTVRNWISKGTAPQQRSQIVAAATALLGPELSSDVDAVLRRLPGQGQQAGATRHAVAIAAAQEGFGPQAHDVRRERQDRLSAAARWVGTLDQFPSALDALGLVSERAAGSVPSHRKRDGIDSPILQRLVSTFEQPGGLDWQERLVVALGESCAGKTHALATALARVSEGAGVPGINPERVLVVVPRRSSWAYNEIAQLVVDGLTGHNEVNRVVLFCDDFGDILSSPELVSPRTICETRHYPVIFMATLWPENLPNSDDLIRRLYHDRSDLLSAIRAASIEVPSVWTPEEILDVRHHYPSYPLDEPRPGSWFRSQGALKAAFDDLYQSQDNEVRALCEAVADLAWVAPSGASQEILETAFEARYRKRQLEDEDFSRALRRSTTTLDQQVYGTGQQILEKSATDGWTINDSLIEHARDRVVDAPNPDLGDFVDFEQARAIAEGLVNSHGGLVKAQVWAEISHRRAAESYGVGSPIVLATVVFCAEVIRRTDPSTAYERICQLGSDLDSIDDELAMMAAYVTIRCLTDLDRPHEAIEISNRCLDHTDDHLWRIRIKEQAIMAVAQRDLRGAEGLLAQLLAEAPDYLSPEEVLLLRARMATSSIGEPEGLEELAHNLEKSFSASHPRALQLRMFMFQRRIEGGDLGPLVKEIESALPLFETTFGPYRFETVMMKVLLTTLKVATKQAPLEVRRRAGEAISALNELETVEHSEQVRRQIARMRKTMLTFTHYRGPGSAETLS